MRYNNIIKRGIKDTTWLDNFLKEKLNGNMCVTINASEKMYYNIFRKYGRILKSYIYKYGLGEYEILAFQDDNYMFTMHPDYWTGIKGKYSYYFKIDIVDIKKSIDYQYNERMKNIDKRIKTKVSNEIYELYKKVIRLDVEVNFDLGYNLVTNNTTYKRLKKDNSEIEKEIEKLWNKIDKLEELEGIN